MGSKKGYFLRRQCGVGYKEGLSWDSRAERLTEPELSPSSWRVSIWALLVSVVRFQIHWSTHVCRCSADSD